jgi:hypothetical protein
MTVPDSPIDLLTKQSVEIQLNALLEIYLVRHASSPARETVEQAIRSPSLLFKMRVLGIVATSG